ncbi:hypothetical protein [Terrisporobacter hibernicus]|uniref:Uncharacterized protein n=1 Tax=Terrisporobacter hibernicus TaxID=2813371 RepID=A0AAX2ZE74_9FIRM|nr:hypothetical protein [Terrisporobacter hibernicus]UEL47341.1 hypothetical protein JW646_17175 [Terrisporobacter hibernicus]
MNIVQKLEMKIDRICEMKDEIDTIKENIELEKVNIIKEMTDMQVDRLETLNGVALVMDYERGTLNSELVENGLHKATRGTDVSVDDCRAYTHLNYLLIKRKNS